MKNWKAVIQYEGTRYQGWQKQTSTDNTIQGKMETLLTKMCGEPIEISASGRTDAGVHALGQVANFHTEATMSVEEILEYCNRYLPEDMDEVRQMQERDRRLSEELARQAAEEEAQKEAQKEARKEAQKEASAKKQKEKKS